jgi:outer membrane lipoprotein-sorting protein
MISADRLPMLAALLWLMPVAALATTVDELVAKHVAARGGTERMKAIRSVEFTGKLEISGDFVAEFALLRRIERPDRARTDATLQGMTMVRAWDGREGWAISPLFGRKDPERVSRDESKDLIDLADLDGPLVDAAAKGSRVDYLGTEDIDGTDAHKLRVTTKDGDVQYVYLDPDYFLVIRILYLRSVRGARVETETDFGNYEKVDGVYFPFSVDSGAKGEPRTRRITIEKARANVELPDALFRFPVAAK